MKFLNFNKYFLLIGLFISFNALQASADGGEAAWKAAEDALEKRNLDEKNKDKNQKDLADKQAEKDRLQQEDEARKKQIDDDFTSKEDEISSDKSKDEQQKQDAISVLEKQRNDALKQVADQYAKQNADVVDQINTLKKTIASVESLIASQDQNLQSQVDKAKKYISDTLNKTEATINNVFKMSSIDPLQEASVAKKHKEDLSQFDGADDFLTSDQKDKKETLQIEIDFLSNDSHAKILHTIFDGVNKAVEKYNDDDSSRSDEISSMKSSIESGYGTNTTPELDRERQDLLKVLSRADSATSDTEKQNEVNNLQEIIQENIHKNIEESDILHEKVDTLPNTIKNKDQMSSAFENNKTDLKEDVNKLDVNLGKIISGQVQETVNSVLEIIKTESDNGGYDITKTDVQDVLMNIDYSVYSLATVHNELKARIDYFDGIVNKSQDQENYLKFLKQQKDRVEKESQKLIAKRIDFQLNNVAIINAELQKKIDQYNSSPKEAVQVVKSTISTIGSKIIDIFSTLFKRFKNVVFNKTVIEFKDQSTEIQKGLQVMQEDMQAYEKKVQPLIDTVDRKFDVQKQLPDAKTVDALYKEAKDLLGRLEKEAVQFEIRENGFNQVDTLVQADLVLMFIDKELQAIPEFREDENDKSSKFVVEKMKGYFKSLNNLDDRVLIELGKDYFKNKGITDFSDKNITQENLKECGEKLFDTFKHKNFLDMDYKEVLLFVRSYEIINNPDGESKGTGARNFQFLLERGGDFAWQQVKTVLQGGKSYQSTIEDPDTVFDDYVNNINTPKDSINMMLLPLKQYLLKAINDLNLWIDSVDKVLGNQPSSWENQQTAIDQRNVFLQYQADVERVGRLDIYKEGNAIMPLPPLDQSLAQ